MGMLAKLSAPAVTVVTPTISYFRSLEEYDGFPVISDPVLFPASPYEFPESDVLRGGVSVLHPIQGIAHTQDPFPYAEAGYAGRQYGPGVHDRSELSRCERSVADENLTAGETDRTVRFHTPYHNTLRVECLQLPERPYPPLQPFLRSREEEGLATGSLHLGQRSVAAFSRRLDPFDASQFGPSDAVQEVAPALRLLRWFDDLDEDKTGAQLSEGAYAMGTVEDQVAVLVRGYYYGVALFPFTLDAPPQTVQAVFIVGLVKDKTLQLHQAKVFERGDQVL